MTTAIQLITRSMRLAGAIGKGEAPDDDEAVDGLAAMNSMMDSFSIERLNVYYIVEETLTLVAGTATYTMGTGGDLNTSRPTRIEDSCFIRYPTNSDFPLTLLNYEGYAAIVDKTTQSNIPQYLFPDMRNPLARLTFWPVPSDAAAVPHIFSWKQLQQFAALTDALALPPGYEDMIAFNLCVRWAGPEFGQKVPDEVKALAVMSKANVKRINAPAPIMRSEAGVLTRSWPANNIYTGT